MSYWTVKFLDKNVLIVAISADRGLCGGFNNNISKEVRKRALELENKGKTVQLIIIGRKAYTVLKNEMGEKILGFWSPFGHFLASSGVGVPL